MTSRTSWWIKQSARVGVSECQKHGHVQPFPVLQERSKAPVAQFKWTVAVSGKRLLIFAASEALNFELQKHGEVADAELKVLIEVDLLGTTRKFHQQEKGEKIVNGFCF